MDGFFSVPYLSWSGQYRDQSFARPIILIRKLRNVIDIFLDILALFSQVFDSVDALFNFQGVGDPEILYRYLSFYLIAMLVIPRQHLRFLQLHFAYYGGIRSYFHEQPFILVTDAVLGHQVLHLAFGILMQKTEFLGRRAVNHGLMVNLQKVAHMRLITFLQTLLKAKLITHSDIPIHFTKLIKRTITGSKY